MKLPKSRHYSLIHSNRAVEKDCKPLGGPWETRLAGLVYVSRKAISRPRSPARGKDPQASPTQPPLSRVFTRQEPVVPCLCLCTKGVLSV